MDKLLRDKWITALRSGDYKQGKYYLRQVEGDTGESSYCCLGVLCDIMGIEWTETDSGTFSVTAYGLDGNKETLEGALPEGIRMKVGFKRGMQAFLMRANDQEDRTFDQIADIIETFL